ncbi:MAG: hypothetical protein HQK99_13225 [Nitrospirae bacterium]|nr:hypothetical protein [Nitrospirota bacterium]
MSEKEKCPHCGGTMAKDLDNLTGTEKKHSPVIADSCKEEDIVAAQCVCDMEWRAINPGDDSDDCRCSL